MWPRSSSNSGCSPCSSVAAAIASPSCSSVDAGLLLVGEEAAHQRRGQHAAEVADDRADHAAAGVVAAHHQLVGADALAALEPPGEHRGVHLQPLELERRAGDRRCPSRGGGSPRRAATARGRRCAGGRRRRRRSTGGRPRRSAARPPAAARPATSSWPWPSAPRGRRASASSPCPSSTSTVIAAQRVELVPLRRAVAVSTRCRGSRPCVPPTVPRTRHTRAAHAAEVAPTAVSGSSSSSKRPGSPRAGGRRRRSNSRPLGQRRGRAALEQQRRPRPRRAVELAVGVEEGDRERRGRSPRRAAWAVARTRWRCPRRRSRGGGLRPRACPVHHAHGDPLPEPRNHQAADERAAWAG